MSHLAQLCQSSIFVSATSSSIFGGNDWTLSENTLSVFGCVCVFRGGGGLSPGDCGGSGLFVEFL